MIDDLNVVYGRHLTQIAQDQDRDYTALVLNSGATVICPKLLP